MGKTDVGVATGKPIWTKTYPFNKRNVQIELDLTIHWYRQIQGDRGANPEQKEEAWYAIRALQGVRLSMFGSELPPRG